MAKRWGRVMAATLWEAASAARADCPPAAVHLVRHAEKAPLLDDPDVPLAEAGRARAAALAERFAGGPLDAIYATHLRRTQQTVAPLAEARDLEIRVLPAAAVDRLLARLATAHCGETVLVAGHSNTVPAVLQGLGIATPPAIAEDAYGLVYTVRWPTGQPLLELERFGAPPSSP